MKVAKFGGSSLANAQRFRQVIDIIRADPERRHIVVSAPGKRFSNDHKITDLLLGLCTSGLHKHARDSIAHDIESRFYHIVESLGISFDIAPYLAEICNGTDQSADYITSRGEYLAARILAEALGYTFVHASGLIRFDEQGRLDMANTLQNRSLLLGQRAGYVIPGFYGSMPGGKIRTFARGGSDLTGALVAAMVDADVYENWTDVPGLLAADPTVVTKPKIIESVTYKELRELTYMGARVLHDEVIFPLRERGIPIHLRNTNTPERSGTMVVPDTTFRDPGSIVGIAGRKDFTVLTIEKTLMNQEMGFFRRVCSVMERNNVSIEHIPGGIDTLSVIVATEELNGALPQVMTDLQKDCAPDDIVINPDTALICTVGATMATPGVAARLFAAVATANIPVHMIDQGSSEMSIIIGVDNADYEKAIRAIYQEFEKDI